MAECRRSRISATDYVATSLREAYELMAIMKPDAVLVLGDTNSCLSVIARKAPSYSDISYGGGQPLQG